ncbi:interferon-induced protein 44-like isoform X2 [Varanus komodoensis]|uniref:interferon-induced protein 44-like isoform X2 n=1 Tax=Varanus komodoensis TaxID=61221 RepID=UPI001CF7E9D9|nr:interferon-induced protein 44-like isoform X2 [Varanus komodoensis]
MVDVKSRLTQEEKKVLLQLLECDNLSLLFKATVHGFTASAFHNICNQQGPTVAVAYNSSGYIFGGFSAESYTSRGTYVYDDKSFLFRLKGSEKEPSPLKFPFKSANQAVYDNSASGPNFGAGALVLMHQNTATVFANANIANYAFHAEDLFGNGGALLECEVYRVEGVGALLQNPYRMIEWTAGGKEKLMNEIRNFKPSWNSVPKFRILFLGPVGAGKSSFFNSVNSVYQGYVTSNAIAGSDSTSVTMQYRNYEVQSEDGKPVPIIFCDSMGLEEKEGTGLNIGDVPNILKGHIPDRYQFNPCAVIQPNAPGYVRNPSLKDQIHCVVLIIDGSTVEILSDKMEQKLRQIRKETKILDIPVLAVLTKVDAICSFLEEDVSDVYRSKAVVKQAE